MVETFSPYYRLWGMVIDFQYAMEEWLQGSLLNLNESEVRKQVEDWFNECGKVIRLFEPFPLPHGVATDLRDAIQGFMANIPIIENLCREAMQPQHWTELFERIEADIDMEDGLTLQMLLDIDILTYLETVEAVSSVAQKQWTLKNALLAMKSEWKTVEEKIEKKMPKPTKS